MPYIDWPDHTTLYSFALNTKCRSNAKYDFYHCKKKHHRILFFIRNLWSLQWSTSTTTTTTWVLMSDKLCMFFFIHVLYIRVYGGICLHLHQFPVLSALNRNFHKMTVQFYLHHTSMSVNLIEKDDSYWFYWVHLMVKANCVPSMIVSLFRVNLKRCFFSMLHL